MNDPNKDIEDFFTKARNEDANIVTPSLESLLPPKKVLLLKKYRSIGVAAAVLLFVALLAKQWDAPTAVADQEVIIALEVPAQQTEALLLEEPSIYEWESASAFLINDFND
jgi:hypothetical protein